MGCILQECHSQPVGKIQLLLGSQHKTCVVSHSTTRPSQQIPGVQNIPKNPPKFGDYIMLLYLSMGSDLIDFHKSDDRWNYSCEGCYWGLALTNCHLPRMSASLLISFSSCGVSMLTTSNFLRLNSTTLSFWKRGCLSCFWKASERMHGSNLKEQAQGGHFFYWGWSFILHLVSSSERNNCRVGEEDYT